MQVNNTSYARQSSYNPPAPYPPSRTPPRTPYTRTQSAPEPPTPTPTTAAPATPAPHIFAPSTPIRTPARNPWPTPSPTPAGNQLVALAQQAIAANQPPEATDEGQRQYTTAYNSWMTKYGGDKRPDFGTDHFPLTPGSSPMGSGECFQCGHTGHMGRDCVSTNKIPQQEATWRARVNGAVNPRRTRFAESPGLLPVFQIGDEDLEIDPAVYDTTELRFADDWQGNAQGSRY